MRPVMERAFAALRDMCSADLHDEEQHAVLGKR